MGEKIIHVSGESIPELSPSKIRERVKNFCQNQAKDLGLTVDDSICETCPVLNFDNQSPLKTAAIWSFDEQTNS